MPDKPEGKNQKAVPDALAGVVGAESTAILISEICFKNGVKKEEEVEEIAYQIGLSLLGRLPLEELPEIFEKKLNLDKETAQKIFNKVSEFIFGPVKSDLDALYRKNAPLLPAQKPKNKDFPQKPDAYKEPIE